MKDDIIYDDGDNTVESEIADGDGAPEQKIAQLKKALAECRKEKEEYLAGWQRSRADFINARKEEEERRSEFARLREEKILRDLLDVADSFDRAAGFNQEGVSHIHKQFADILKHYGVSAIDTSVGKPFDPSYHEAIGQAETDVPEEDDTVKEELQRGYSINGRVLRPAKVKVALYKPNN